MKSIDSIFPWLIFALFAGVWVAVFLRAFYYAQRRRLFLSLPTVKTTGVYMGLVEVKGVARKTDVLKSRWTQRDCVYYAWKVEEEWREVRTKQVRDANGGSTTRVEEKTGWKTIAEGTSEEPFFLADDAGEVRIQPQGAELSIEVSRNEVLDSETPGYYEGAPQEAIRHSTNRRRFTESLIALDQPLYVVGPSREREDVVAPEIAKDAYGTHFIISTNGEESIASNDTKRFWGLHTGGFLLSILVVLTLKASLGDDVSSEAGKAEVTQWVLSALGTYVGCVVVGWALMVYNSLVGLRERVRQAFANIDVQLKRRADLIPQLVATVQTLRDYEKNVQIELAKMRAQMRATPPGIVGEDPIACAGLVQTVCEQYPELESNQGFMKLTKTLADTENRIAMARGFYEETLSFYRTRLESFPDCLVGRFLKKTVV